MNFFTTNSSNLSNPSSFSMTSALSTQNNSNTTSQFGTSSGGLFGSRTQPSSFGFTSNMPNSQEKGGGFGNILQSSNMNNSNTSNGGLFTQAQNDAQKTQGGFLGNALNAGKENVSQNTTNNAGLGGWKAAGAQMQSIFGSQVSGLGLGSTGSQSLITTTNFMGGSANGNSNNLISSTGTVGYSYNVNNLSKTKENIPIYTVTGVQGFREKTLDELRGEDYNAMKNSGISDQRLMELKNMWQSNQTSGGSGSTNLLSMITSNNSNTQQTNPTLNSFSQNQNSVPNLQSSLFGSNNTSQPKPNTPVFGPSSGPSINPNSLSLGGGNQQSLNQGGFGLASGLGSSMFSGMQSQSNSSGLMSSNQNQNQQSQSQSQSQGGLFNATSTAQTAAGNGGMFSGSVNSLLGAQTQNQNQNSTIGGNSSSLGSNMGSRFGLGTTSSNNNSMGLMNNNNNNNPQASAGTQNPVFGGNSSANNQGTGLFNATNGNQNTGGRPFNMNQASQPSANNVGSSMMGLNSFGMQNQPQPLGQISQNTFSGLQSSSSSSSSSSNNSNPLGALQSSTKELWSSMLATGLNISFGDFNTENWQPEVAVKQYDLFGNTFGYKSEDGGNVRQNYPYNNENMFSRNMKSKFGQNPFEKSESKRSFYQSSKTLSDFKRPYPHFSNINHPRVKPSDNDIFLQKGRSLKRVMRLDYDSEQNIEKKKNAEIARFYSYITVCVAFNKEDDEEDTYTFDVGLNDTCSELKNHVLKQVLNSEGLSFVRYKMLYNQKILKEQMTIQEAGLQDREKIYLIPDFDSRSNSEDSTNLSEASRKCLASEDVIPIIPKHLKTVPALVKLSRMSEDELANIQDFSVYNENARITFPGKTDIRGMNLGEMIVLRYRSVEVYPHSYHAEMPRAGKGLNKKATIEFYNWALPTKYENQASEYVAKLKKKFNSLNAEYRKYDISKQSLVISVQNFSSL